MKWEEQEAVAVVSQPHGCPVWSGVLPPSASGDGPGSPPSPSLQVSPQPEGWCWWPQALACLLWQRKVISMTSKSRERFLVAEWWGKIKVRSHWPGVRCRCPVGPASAVIQSEVSAYSPRGSLIVPHFAYWVLSHTLPLSRGAVGYRGVSWQWCHRLCQCESCPELG